MALALPPLALAFSFDPDGPMTQQKRPKLRAVAAGAAVDAEDAEPSVAPAAVKKATAPRRRAPRKVTPVSVTAAARSNDRRQLLVALRNRIATAIDDPKTGGPALAALIKQQREVVAELEAIDGAAAQQNNSATPQSAVATTPHAAWDESMI